MKKNTHDKELEIYTVILFGLLLVFDLKKIKLTKIVHFFQLKGNFEGLTTDFFNMDKQIITIDDSEDEVALKAGQQPLQESG